MAKDKEYVREERRTPLETRENDGGVRVVEGYALLFDTPSDGLDFTETIATGALDGVIERSDVFALLDHDSRRGVLARCRYGQGSLSLAVDAKGLRYSFELPDTALAKELAENLRRGEVSESSFAFTVEEDTWERSIEADGTEHWTRRITKIRELYDVSPVYRAAYSATSVDLRGMERRKAQDEAERRDTVFEEFLNKINI